MASVANDPRRITSPIEVRPLRILYVNVIEGHAGWGAEWFVERAFRRLGRETCCIDFRRHAGQLPAALAHAPPCDVFFLQRGDDFPLELIVRQPRPRLFWASELVRRCADQDPLLSSGLFDHVFVHSRQCLETVASRGWLPHEACSVLLNGFDPEIHRPEPATPRDIDVLFAGSITPRRADWLERLRGRFSVTVANVYGRELVRSINRAKVVLNIHADDVRDIETRVFETLGSGACLVSERLSDDNPFTNGEHLAEAESFDGLCEQVAYYLAQPDEREALAARGHAEALARHTYLDRAEEILRIMEHLRDGKRRQADPPRENVGTPSAIYAAQADESARWQPTSAQPARQDQGPSSWRVEPAAVAAYMDVCERAASEPGFGDFKRQPAFRRMLEHVTREQGQQYLECILRDASWLAHFFARFQENDRLGCPETFEFGAWRFSPTTLRYVKVLSDLVRLVGTLDGLEIVEIGGGYGGQCRIVGDVFRFRSYTLVDLPAAARLQQAYLAASGATNVRCLAVDDFRPRDCDLVISNFALSELVAEARDFYGTAVIRRSRAGYVTWNATELPPEGYFQAGSTVVEEVPRTGAHNRVVTWAAPELANGPLLKSLLGALPVGIEARP